MISRKTFLQFKVTALLVSFVLLGMLVKEVASEGPVGMVVKAPLQEEPKKTYDTEGTPVEESGPSTKKSAKTSLPEETPPQPDTTPNETANNISSEKSGGSGGSSGGGGTPPPEEEEEEDLRGVERTLAEEGTTVMVTLHLYLEENTEVLLLEEHLPEDAVVVDAGTGNTETPSHIKWAFVEEPLPDSLTYIVKTNNSAAIEGVFATDLLDPTPIMWG